MPLLLRIRNVSTKSCRENRNNVLRSVTFFPDNHAIYEIMSKNMAEPESQQTIWSMRTAWWITKAMRAQAHALASTPTPACTRTEIYLLLVYGKNFVNASKCYVLHTLPVLFGKTAVRKCRLLWNKPATAALFSHARWLVSRRALC
jgi:hypothetical protein